MDKRVLDAACVEAGERYAAAVSGSDVYIDAYLAWALAGRASLSPDLADRLLAASDPAHLLGGRYLSGSLVPLAHADASTILRPASPTSGG